MRLKITLSLLAIILGLLSYIFYIEPSSDNDPFPNDRKNILGELAVGIDFLSIQNPTTGQNITFEQQNKKWMLISPYEWPANEFAVQKILTQLRFLERITSFETNIVSNSGVSLGDYGLSPPELSVEFGREGQRHRLGIGKVTDIGNNLYILSIDQSRIHVVDRSLLDSLSGELADLRSARLFDTAVFEVNSWNIQVRDAEKNLRAWFARQGENWIFETPIRARADSASVNTLLNRCLNLQAESIIASNPSDLSPYGLQNAPYRIAIESGDKREVLEIGNLIGEDSDFRYAKKESSPTVFQMRIDFLDLLENAQTKLRQRRIFEIDTTAASTVTITRRDTPPLTLQKLEGGSWEVITRDENQGIYNLKGDSKTIEEMLLWLDQLKAVPDTGFVNDAPSAPDLESYGLEVPEFSITISSNKRHNSDAILETPESTTLYIGDYTPGDAHESFVKVENKDFVYSVYNDVFDRISASPDQYKDRQIFESSEGTNISKITITRIADKEILAEFDFNTESEASSEAAALASVIENLRVESFNADGFTSTIEIAGRSTPWAYTVSTEFTQESENGSDPHTSTLFISETTGGPLLLGGLPEQNLGFRFELGFVDAFSKIVFDRIARDRPTEPFSSTPLPNAETSDPTAPTSGATDVMPSTTPETEEAGEN